MARIIDVKTDPNADAIYLRFSREPHASTKNLDDERHIDYDAQGNPIGVELLCISQGVNLDRLPSRAQIERVLAGLQIRVLTPAAGPSRRG